MGINPKVGGLINTKYYALLEGSPAINYVPETCTDCPASDIRGASRPTNNRYDAGAYEYLVPGTPSVVLPYAGNQEVTGSNRVFPVPLAALVLDSMGSPVPNVVVSFKAPAAGPSAVFTSTGSNETSTATGADGLAIPGELTANAIRGWFTVHLSTPSLLTNSFMLYIIDLFVRQDGSNTDNDCTNVAAPCQTLAYAVSKAMPGASIRLTGGVHDVPSQLSISIENLFISGDWNSNFTIQNQSTILDGMTRSHRIYVTKNIHFSNLTFRNFSTGLFVNSQTATVENSSFINNSTGIYIPSGTLNLINSTVSQNTSAGIYSHGKLNILSSTIVNQPEGITSYGQTLITSSIVALNTNNCSGYTITSGGYNVFGTICNVSQSTDQLTTDPKIGPLIKNRHHPLVLSSPAVNTIPYPNPSVCPAKDIRGVSRPAGEKCDAGAYEYTPPGPAVDIQVSNGSNQVSGTGRTFVRPLEALVFDAQGSPVSGISVTFTAPPGSGPSAVFKDSGTSTYVALTNEHGVAAAWVTANDLSGSYSVTASRTGMGSTVSFSLSNINLYVSTTGSDTSNDCRSSASPCKTLQYALTKSVKGVSIYLAGGSHPISNTIISLEDLYITGGWNAAFTLQNNQTILRGGGSQIEVRGKNNTFTQLVFTEFSTGLYISTGSVILNYAGVINNTTGIQNYGSVTVFNSTISGNKNTGMFNSGTVNIRNSTFANNLVYALYQSNSKANLSLENSIIAPPQICSISDGLMTSNGNNLLISECSAKINPKSTDKIGVNPKLSTLINLTYHALLPGSPAIDAIDPVAPGSFCPAYDQRGVSRPSGSHCDIGAYEYTSPGSGTILQVRSGSQQTVGLLQVPMLPLEVQVTDQIGSPVSGVAVTFTAPISGPSGTFWGSTTAVFFTDQSGVATGREFRANAVSGSYQLQVSVAGIAQAVTIAINNGNSLYVNTSTGSDSSNNCRSSISPCKTIARGVDQAAAADTIMITQGSFPAPSLTISKSVFLSGGWNPSYTIQDGISLSETTNSSIRHLTISSPAVVSIDRLDFSGGTSMVYNMGTLRLSNGSFRKGCNALYNTGNLNLYNVTIYSNYCPSDTASGIYNASGQTVITNVTIANNYGLYKDNSYMTKANGAGILNYSGSVIAKNSIITNNRSNLGFDCSGKISSAGNNLVGIADGCKWEAADGDIIGTLRNPVDARLAALSASENGPFVRPLLMDSPAIDAANPLLCPSQDQRGQVRPVNSGCDIGAFEGFISGVPAANAVTFDAETYLRLPGKFLCSSPNTSCTGARDLDADNAHQHAAGFFEFLVSQHGRNGIEGAGYPAISTVHYGYNFKNAFWTNRGFQMVYGNGFSKADDVAAHEITHGITSSTSNLFYYYQSGAINESLSDLWGEYYDQETAGGNDSDAVKWLIGEDLSIGALRSMKNPPAYKDPDKMTSTYYYKGPNDNGGVHWNSGVNNKAIYLMVAGGTFNNRTVRALGWEKTAALYYYAQTRLLTSASDYKDLYYALDQACTALIGTADGMTADDCKQVISALDAVQMNRSPVADYNPDSPDCPTGMTKFPTNLFYEDFENGLINWSLGAKTGNPHWGITPGKYDYEFATSGRYALYGDDYDDKKDDRWQTSDSYAEMKEGIEVPVGSATMLHFNHAFGFEWITSNGVNYHFDGGVVEYTIDNGASWKDAKALFSAGRNYNGSIYSGTYYGNNPLKGRAAFVRDSRGYVSSRYNLTSLAGKTVRFRWRLGTDNQYYRFGWVVDDVRMYRCIGAPARPALLSPATGSLTTNYQPKLDWKDAANVNRYELQVALDSAFSNIYFTGAQLSQSEYQFTTDLPYNTRYYWRVRTINEIDQISTWSPVWSFRTALLPAEITAPAVGSVPDSLRPEFQWSPSPDALSYTLVVSTYANYSSPLINTTVKDIRYQPTRNLPINKKLYWRVRVNGDNTSAWRTATFTSPYPPPAPVLTSPAHNTRIYSYTPTLSWKASVPAAAAPPLDFYHAQVDDNADFSSPLYDVPDLDSTSFMIPENLLHNQRFYWRVRAVNTSGQYAWWASRSFSTALIAPEITAPAAGTVPDSLRPGFEWSISPDAVSYTLVVSAYSNYSSPLLNVTVNGTRFTPNKNLPVNKKLYWRVRANGTNPSAWTASTFTSPNPLPAPTIVSPVNAQRMKTLNPELKWKPTTAPTFAYYHLQVSASADFASPLLYEEQNYLAASFQIPDELQPDRKYYWRVKAVNTDQQYAWWNSVFFIIPIQTPELLSPTPDQVIAEPKPAFDWTDVPSAESYSIIISSYADLSSPLINTKVTSSEYTAAKVLPRGKNIYWRVRANGSTGAGVWTPVQKFKIQ
jgi:hypothetical protein